MMTQSIRTQRGMTFWGLLFVAGVFAFALLMSFKLLPAYMTHGKVRTALENVAKQPDAANMDRGAIAAALDRRFAIDDVNGVDLQKSLTVDKQIGVTKIRIAYEVRIPLAYNVTALINFDDTVQAGAKAAKSN